MKKSDMSKGKIKNDFLCHNELYCHIRLQKKKKKGSWVIFSVCLVLASNVSFFLLFSLFLLLFMVSLHFLVLFMNLIILFQILFSFIYNNFNKKFLVSSKKAVPKRPWIPKSFSLLVHISISSSSSHPHAHVSCDLKL